MVDLYEVALDRIRADTWPGFKIDERSVRLAVDAVLDAVVQELRVCADHQSVRRRADAIEGAADHIEQLRKPKADALKGAGLCEEKD